MTLTASPLPEVDPTSPGQNGSVPAGQKEKALWLLEQFAPGSGGVNGLSVTVRVAGRLDVRAAERALNSVVAGHEALSTVFIAADDHLQARLLAESEIDIAILETDLPPGTTAEVELETFVGRSFAFDGTPLIRAQIVHEPHSDVLCVVFHHLVFDTISATVFLGRFVEAYSGGTADDLDGMGGDDWDFDAPTPAVRVPALHELPPSDRSNRFWDRQLADFDAVSPSLVLGRDAGSSTTLLGGVLSRPLSAEAVEVVRKLQVEWRTTEAVVLLAAYYALLARHGGGPDLVIGTPVNVRPAEAADAIGYHVNVVPLRMEVDLQAGFGSLVKTCRSVFMNSITHSDVPVDALMDRVVRPTSGWRNTLFRHVFNYVPGNGSSHFELAGLDASVLSVENGYSKFDLELFVLTDAEGITLRTAFHLDAFTAEEVGLLVERFEALLLAAGEDTTGPVGALDLLGVSDRAVVTAANATGAERAPSVLELFLDQARQSPDAVAVSDGTTRTSYGELASAAIRNGSMLVASGVQPGEVVAVAGPRSAGLAAAALGTWVAGASYLAVDPSHPVERIRHQLEDSGTAVVLCAPGVELPTPDGVQVIHYLETTGQVATELEISAVQIPDDDAQAYELYTSGSTGRPKGTLLTHGNLNNLIAAFSTDLSAAPGIGVLWSTTFSFDISTLELFLPLTCGGRLVVAADSMRHNGSAIADLVLQDNVQVLQATPTVWRMLIGSLGSTLAGRTVLCGGEPLPPALARQLLDTGADVRNVYGPTETCIWSTADTVSPAELPRVTVGRPLRNTQLFVVDAGGADVGLLVPGELCIAGAGVGLGYHRRDELTAERFGRRPDLGRFYRTGDRARWLPDGRMELLGRADRQVKVRGVRIELSEIEAVLIEHPAVANAAVLLHGEDPENRDLVAFVQPAAGTVPDSDELWKHAAGRLSVATVPNLYFGIDVLPTNGAAKIDYPALAGQVPDRKARSTDARPSSPDPADVDDAASDPMVDRLRGLWSEVLGRTDINSDANFFNHGGHSLLAVKLTQSIAEMTGTDVPLTELFATPTPRGVADLLRRVARPNAS